MAGELKKKNTLVEWIAIIFGFASIIIGVIVAIVIEAGKTYPASQYISGVSLGAVLIGIMIAVPLLIVGAVRLSKKSKYNERIEEIELRAILETKK